MMDMTSSMQPYINDTTAAIDNIAKTITAGKLATKVKFGLVGYRDDHEEIPGMEWTAKAFTSELVDHKGLWKS